MNIYQLQQFIHWRIEMFEDNSTFWGRNHSDLYGLYKWMRRHNKLPHDACHVVPDDPSIPLDFIWCDMYMLKRKYLNRLRQEFMKRERRRKR